MRMTVEADESWTPLRERALATMQSAHARYSNFRVGAALEASDGRIFGGCNVENASFPVTMCAERVALGTAIVDGAREFDRLFLCSDDEKPVAPCGMCRQALAEFAPDLRIVSLGTSGATQSWRLSDLLPDGFELVRAPTDGDSA